MRRLSGINLGTLASLYVITPVLIILIIGSAAKAAPKAAAGKPGASAEPIARPILPSREHSTNDGEVDKAVKQRGPIHFDGFVETQLRLSNKDEWPSDRGFSLNDASLFIDKKFQRGLSAGIEVPVASTYTAAASPSQTIGFVPTRAQAYFRHEYDHSQGMIISKLGQFAAPYGIESNSSRDRLFADAGLIRSYVTPTVLQGASGSYSSGKLTFSATAANMPTRGTMTKETPAIGIQGRLDAGGQRQVYGALGVLAGDEKNRTQDKSYLLVDLIGGFRHRQMKFDFSLDSFKAPGGDKSAFVLGAWGEYTIPDRDLGLGARIEYLKDAWLSDASLNNGATLLYDQLLQVSVGPTYHFTDEVKLRADVSLANFKANSTGGGADLSAIALSGSLLAGF